MEKNKHIETIRGIAIILVLFYHIISFLKIQDNSHLHQLRVPFDYLRMPLFTVISGFVYSLRPVMEGKVFLFYKKKLVRLMFPFLFWSTVTYFAFYFAYPNAKESGMAFWEILLYPYIQFWFLQVLLIIFLLLPLLELNGWLSTPKKWLLCTGVSFAILFAYVHLLFPDSTPAPSFVMSFFSYTGVFYLFPFFLLGIGIQRFFYQKLNPQQITVLAVIVILGIGLRELYFYDIIEGEIFRRDRAFGIVMSILSTVLLLNLNFKSNVLGFVGYYAYPIYLVHVLAYLIVVYPLHKLWIFDNIILVPCMILSGIFIPILIHRMSINNRWARLIMFGIFSTRKKPELPKLGLNLFHKKVNPLNFENVEKE